MPQRGRALGTGRVTGIRVLGNWEVCIMGLAEHRAGHIPESSDKPTSSRAKRGDLAVRKRLPRTLRVLAMTLELKRPASYRWIRDIINPLYFKLNSLML